MHVRYGSDVGAEIQAVLLEGIILVPMQTDGVIMLQYLGIWSDPEHHTVRIPESTTQRQNVRGRT